jgi:hypothetical protein
MTSSTWNKQVNNNETIVSENAFPELRKKLFTDVEQAKSVFVHFDHIQGESEIDRDQIFSNLLKAVSYLGLDVGKIDFHRQD